ncbi:MAG: O-antigen ligase family protein [Vicinamibacteria bacterium]|nr:O-antigen ligase family protein [Vicinamibacteria bacterium]
MKYLVFAVALLGGVPVLAMLCSGSERRRGWLLAAIAASAVLGDVSGVNFFSTADYRGPDRGFEITLTDLMALGLSGAIVLKSAGRVAWIPTNTVPLALLFASGLVSAFGAASPLLSTFTLFKGLRLYVLYWAVYNAIHTGVDLAWVRRGLVAAGLWMSFFAVKQKYIEGLYRIHGTFDHSNGVPLYANLVIPFLLLSAVSDRRLGRREALLTLAAALGLVFSVVTTQSRAGTLLAGGLVLGTLFTARLKAPSSRVNRVTLGVLAILIVGGAMVADTIIRRFEEAPESSEEARNEFNAAARDMARDHRFGVGLNNFSKALTDNDGYRAHLVVMKNEEQGGVAHHIYLLTAAEMGWSALAFFLLVLGRFWWIPIIAGLRTRGFDGGLQLSVAFGMTALHAQGFFEWGFRVTPIACQFLILAAAGMAQARGLRKRRARPSLAE